MPPPVQRATALAVAPAAPPFTTTTTTTATPATPPFAAPSTPAAPPFAALTAPAVPPFAATATPPAAPHLTPGPLPGGGGSTPPVVQRAPAKAVPLRKPVSHGSATGAPLPVAPLTPPRPSAARPEMPVATQAVPGDTTPDTTPDTAPVGAVSGDLPPVQRFSFRRSRRTAHTTAALASATAATVVDNLTRLDPPSSRPGPDEPPPPYSDPPPPYEAGAGAPPPGGPPPAYTAVPEGGFDPRDLTDFQLDELVHRIIGRVTRLVRTELRMDRERIGRLRDPR
ncbi:hypothetical protein ACFYZ3_34330 [Streptomyces sp. NPDC001599]|uniref:hypothetical protein n=1 Tax=Streptomyces sp. NPDC001599 TaxID=3364591 RepID=UPI00368BD231